MLLMLQSAQAIKVPARVFPDEKSDIITYVEVNTGNPEEHPQVLDASLGGEWYWSTYEGEFVGYVSKREVLNRKQLRPGTLIRTNPTYRSWVLTKYERGDNVRVRSRLSVGRVSFEKEIPIYFQMPEAIVEEESFVETTPPVQTMDQEVPVQAVDTETPNEVETTADLTPPPSVEELVSPSPIAVIPEMAEEPEPEPIIDPLLEEKPRIPAQELASLAPPPADLYQEFEGFMRVVAADDALVDQFQYQLETRSGRRIVYVKVDELRSGSHEDYIDQWINIRGSLDEFGPDFILFISANSIWVAPEE